MELSAEDSLALQSIIHSVVLILLMFRIYDGS